MTNEELLEILKRTPDVGEVKHVDFADYVVVLKRRQKQDDGSWTTKENPYMAVDGKLAMAVQDHRARDSSLNIATELIHRDEKELVLKVIVSSSYGVVEGVAASSLDGASGAEASNPWEVAETSALGRALSKFGYGLLPGAGLASADDVERVERDKPAKQAEHEVEEMEAPIAALLRRCREAGLELNRVLEITNAGNLTELSAWIKDRDFRKVGEAAEAIIGMAEDSISF